MRILWGMELCIKTSIFWLVLMVVALIMYIAYESVRKIKIINKLAKVIGIVVVVIGIISAIAFPIYEGFKTWNDTNIEHPILTIIGFIFFKGIVDWIIAMLFFPGVKEKSIDAKE